MREMTNKGRPADRSTVARLLRAIWISGERSVYYAAAFLWRLLLVRPRFIGITGSLGKTTCRECLATILGRRFPTVRNKYNQNDYLGVPRTLLRIRPWHKYAVVEMGSARAGMMQRAVRLVRPHVGVFLRVAGNHLETFGSLEAIAREKGKLLECLPKTGTAVVNNDDPLVMSAADGIKAKICTFGFNADAEIHCSNVKAQWPDRLAFTLHEGNSEVEVQTRLVGTHWLPSIMGAVGVARACNVSLEECAAGLEGMQPFMGRLQPVRHPGGGVILRDEVNGSLESLESGLAVLKAARTGRRIILFAGLAYVPYNSRQRFRKVGAMAAECADGAIFISKYFGKYGMQSAVKAGMSKDCVWWFKDLREASEALQSILRSDDVLLLKGRGTQHLTRLVYDQFGPVGCWKKRCSKTILCDLCSELEPSRSIQLID